MMETTGFNAGIAPVFLPDCYSRKGDYLKSYRWTPGRGARDMNLFVMIHTHQSRAYTPFALHSFFRCTPPDVVNRFILIDNDRSLDASLCAHFPSIELIVNDEKKSFAENANKALTLGSEAEADVFILNNDIVFTQGWIDPLLNGLPVLCSPISNQHLSYTFGDLSLKPAMDLEDFEGREREFAAIVAAHRQKTRGLKQVLSTPFFCVKLPYCVYKEVGFFDTSFGVGGAEDNDYCLRAYLHGYGLFLALDSYVLHFQGKSTWRGGESKDETRDRNEKYVEAFRTKWGESLLRLMLAHDQSLLMPASEEARLLKQGRVCEALREIADSTGKADAVPRSLPSAAAVCCVYDDTRWLSESIESVYDSIDRIYFLLGDRPWHGTGRSNDRTREEVERLPDPAGKIVIVGGDWGSEAEQRNAGLEILKMEGFEYCLILDADEIYEPGSLLKLRRFCGARRFMPGWRLVWYTYWKSEKFRIEPVESFKPLVLLRVEGARFVDKRETADPRCDAVPADVCICHHMSYARSDDEVRRKISSFSHANEVIPGWFENVWKAWDSNPELENLHPCWPETYERAIEQPEEALPQVLKSRKKS